MVQILYALRSCTTVALYPPVTKRPDLLPIMPTPQNILDHTQRTKSNGIITIPSIIQVWSQDPPSVNFLKSLEFVVKRLSAFGIWGDLTMLFLLCRYSLEEESAQKLAIIYILLEWSCPHRMEQQSPVLLRTLSRKQKKTRPLGLIWNSVNIPILGGYLRVMEHMNASFRSAVILPF